WSYADGHGNSTQQEQVVEVLDTAGPVPDVGSLAVLRGQCGVTMNTAPSATDACAGVVQGTTTDALSYNQPGSYTVHWTYGDGHGNSTQQEQGVGELDTAGPVPGGAGLPT